MILLWGLNPKTHVTSHEASRRCGPQRDPARERLCLHSYGDFPNSGIGPRIRNMGYSQNKGYPIGGPYNKDSSILGTIMGSSYLGKLPYCIFRPMWGSILGSPNIMKITNCAPRRCVLHTAPGRQGGQATALRISIASRFSYIGRGLTAEDGFGS